MVDKHTMVPSLKFSANSALLFRFGNLCSEGGKDGKRASFTRPKSLSGHRGSVYQINCKGFPKFGVSQMPCVRRDVNVCKAGPAVCLPMS